MQFLSDIRTICGKSYNLFIYIALNCIISMPYVPTLTLGSKWWSWNFNKKLKYKTGGRAPIIQRILERKAYFEFSTRQGHPHPAGLPASADRCHGKSTQSHLVSRSPNANKKKNSAGSSWINRPRDCIYSVALAVVCFDLSSSRRRCSSTSSLFNRCRLSTKLARRTTWCLMREEQLSPRVCLEHYDFSPSTSRWEVNQIIPC